MSMQVEVEEHQRSVHENAIPERVELKTRPVQVNRRSVHHVEI